MTISFDRSFIKSIDKLNDKVTLEKVEVIIHKLEQANNLTKFPNIKKLIGYSNYYRIKIGDYRIGIELIDTNHVRLITILHRKDIYKKFP